MHNCCGAIDGKNIRIRCPNQSGSSFFNSKGYFSIVLQAVADAYHRFRIVRVGSCGRSADSGVFSNSQLGINMRTGNTPFPRSVDRLPGSEKESQFFFIGDNA
ncbi:hypothetical protein DERF_004019 [Dermatophagoides farinae]|uniref:DDE Tnp4 domain-containing protein n=1 Tax=Dermatophagoides farinae TaxID=6954 RepID=A0A922IG63_DERFA|nr:hypothetical protein DERF_004019 [Dermatophagoides farinae]